jgi:hypothetical protein
MPEFTDRIQSVTQDLQQILSELNRAAQSGASADYRERIQRELLSPGVINDFKTAVDDMRMMLWSYMSAAPATKGPDMSLKSVEARLQSVRMQRVTDMLKTLKPDVASGNTGALPEHATFLELIHDIASTAIEKHGSA